MASGMNLEVPEYFWCKVSHWPYKVLCVSLFLLSRIKTVLSCRKITTEVIKNHVSILQITFTLFFLLTKIILFLFFKKNTTKFPSRKPHYEFYLTLLSCFYTSFYWLSDTINIRHYLVQRFFHPIKKYVYI